MNPRLKLLARCVTIALPLALCGSAAYAQTTSFAVWRSADAPEGALVAARFSFNPNETECDDTLAACDVDALEMLVVDPGSVDTLFDENDFSNLAFTFGGADLSIDLVGQAGFTEFLLTGSGSAPNSDSAKTLTPNGGAELTLVRLERTSDAHLYPSSLALNEDAGLTTVVTSVDVFTELSSAGSSISACSGGGDLGSVSLNSGDVQFEPSADVFGTSTFSCTTNTGATILFVVRVNSVNDDPVSTASTLILNEDEQATLNLSGALDTEDSQDALTITVSANPSRGTVTIIGDNTVGNGGLGNGGIVYEPTTNLNGPDSFEYTITDSDGGFVSVTVNVTVNPVNDPPSVTNDVVSADEDALTTFTILANDSDVEGSALTIQSCTTPANGGTVTIETDFLSIKYQSALNYNGSDSFSCTISDGTATSTASVSVTVVPVNDNPTATPTSFTTNEDAPHTIDIADLIADVETLDANFGITTTTPAKGSVSVSGTTLTYAPTANANGSDSFDYIITDEGGLTASATVSVTITPVNDPPSVTNDVVSADEDVFTTFTILANDSDVEGSALTIQSCTAPVNGGTVTIETDFLSIEYQSFLDYNGPDSFDCVISDGTDTSTESINVNVVAQNDAPDANTDNVNTNEDTPITIDVISNDIDVDGETIFLNSCADDGSVNGTLSTNTATGKVTYTPNLDFNGLDFFNCTVRDSNGTQDTGQVIVNVIAVNDAPTATNGSLTATEELKATINLSGNIADVDNLVASLTISIELGDEPSNGTAVVVGQTIEYTGDLDYAGADSFTYTVSDGTDTATATVTVSVINENDTPVANIDTLIVAEDSSNFVNILDNDTDADAGEKATLTIVSCAPGAHGSLTLNSPTAGDVTYQATTANYFGPDTFNCTIKDVNDAEASADVNVTITAVNDIPTAANGTLSLNEDTTDTINLSTLVSDIEDNDADLTISISSLPSKGTASVSGQVITYTPDADYQGADSLIYEVMDSEGGVKAAQVDITVVNVNDAPIAVADTATVAEDDSVTFSITGNDSDIDPADAVRLDTCSVTANGATLLLDTVNGAVDYDAPLNFFGTDTFTCTVKDNSNATATATVTVTVTPVNDAPSATASTLTVDEDTLGTVDLSSNVSDIEDLAGDLVISIKSQPEHGSVSVSGQSINYTGSLDYNGPDSFTYTVTDSGGLTADAQVNVTVTPVNDAPVANPDTATVIEDTPTEIDVVSNDTDVDLNSISLNDPGACTDGAHGSVTSFDSGSVTYDPDPDFFGVDTFTCEVTDGDLTSSATVTVTVTNVDDAPRPFDDDLVVREGLSASVNITLNDEEVDGQTISIQSCGDGSNGTTIISGGVVTYTHDGLSRAPDQFTCIVTDGNLTAPSVVNVTVVYCGDGVKQAPEECDDGNINNCDTCTNACQIGPSVSMVNIPGGTFTMGSKSTAVTSPTRVLDVNDFQISRAEVTVAQYRSCVKSGVCSAPANRSYCTYRPTPGANDHLPVSCVSWDQAQSFMLWCLNDPTPGAIPLSLPTEAQWEYLAKGNNDFTYPSGSAIPSRAQAVYYTTKPSRVCSVGVNLVSGYKAQGTFNLCNMVGNVREWVQDNYAYYSASNLTDASAFENNSAYRVVRGGSWNSKRSSYLMSIYRTPFHHTQQHPEVGFRLACPAHDACGFIGEAP